MHSKIIAITLALMAFGTAVLAQTGVVSYPITVSNNASRSQVLTFGLDPAATDGIDIGLGEAQLPPVPPTGVFDARFVGEDLTGITLGQGSWTDYRQGDQSWTGTKIYELKYQPGNGSTIEIKWGLPDHISGRLQDIITGTLVDVTMAGIDSFTVTNTSAFPKLKMTITYDTPLPIQLMDFSAEALSSTSVRVSWTTLSEVNNYGFNVQRSHNPTEDFTTITPQVIPGHGTTNIPHSYEYIDNSVSEGTWYYRLEQIDLDGPRHYSPAIEVRILTDVDDPTQPKEFSLEQNYPNPFNPGTTIGFTIQNPSFVELRVFDLLGRDVALLVSETMKPGVYEAKFVADQLTSGVYVYQLRAGEFVQTRRLMLMK